MRISDWSSDVCSSDLLRYPTRIGRYGCGGTDRALFIGLRCLRRVFPSGDIVRILDRRRRRRNRGRRWRIDLRERSEEHTSELQSLMRISYAVFCLEKKKKHSHSKLHIKRVHTMT